MKFLPLIIAVLSLTISFKLKAHSEQGFEILPEQVEFSPNQLSEIERNLRNERFRNSSDSALAAFSGADIVGNGSGYIEQNFSYIYQNLDRTISQCLSIPFCSGTKYDQEILREIRDIILENRDRKNRLVFLKGQDFENYFHSELDPSERVAKTGFSPEFPIFINLSLVEELNLGGDLSLILGILAHEVGHQVGISSHTYLDSIASRLRGVFYENTLSIELTHVSLPMKFMVLKARQNFAHDEALLLAAGKLVRLPRLATSFTCARNATLLNSTISNPHWKANTYADGALIAKVEAWGEFSCRAPDGSFFVESMTLTYTIVFDRTISDERKVVFTHRNSSLTLR